MSIVSLVIEIAKLAIIAIILFYVVEQIAAMPVHIRRIVQALIILIVVLYALAMAARPMASSAPMPGPIYAPPSIIR